MKKYLEMLSVPLTLLLIPVALLVTAILGLFIYINLPGNYITIYNNSNAMVTDVVIIGSEVGNIHVGNILPSSKSKIKIPESFNETSVDLEYTDIDNITHTWDIIPYLILSENKNYSYRIN